MSKHAETNHVRNLMKNGKTKSRPTKKGNPMARTSRTGTGKRI